MIEKLILRCTICELHKNGCALPYIGTNAKYMIIGEAPGHNEVEGKTPFVGQAGKILWDTFAEFGYNRDDFFIINTVQCRPVDGGRNGKPTIAQMSKCSNWVRLAIEEFKPCHIILLGGYAKWIYDGSIQGIIRMNGEHVVIYDINDGTLIVHPAFAIYKGDEGREMLRYGISQFDKYIRRESLVNE